MCTLCFLAECSLSLLEDGRSILPSEAGQPDEDGFATIPFINKVAKIKFPKETEVTSLQVRPTGSLSEEDTVSITATFVKFNGETKTSVRAILFLACNKIFTHSKNQVCK